MLYFSFKSSFSDVLKVFSSLKEQIKPLFALLLYFGVYFNPIHVKYSYGEIEMRTGLRFSKLWSFQQF